MKLKVGIIGLGVGESHIAGYREHPECEVVALCDFSDEKLETIKEEYRGIRFTRNAQDILEDPDLNIVSIASYDHFHDEQIESALRSGKHIFVEKPMCLFEEEAMRIRQLLKEYPRLKLSSNLILRMSPRFRNLKKRIGEGGFGKIYYLEGDYQYGRLEKITQGWRGKTDYYSVVYGGAIHLVDLMLWLAGDRVLEVMAYGNRIATENTAFRYNDFVAAVLKFQSGLIGKVTANMGCVHPHFHPFAVYGTRATFINRLKNAELFLSSDSHQSPELFEDPYPGVSKGALLYNFVDSILHGTQPEVSADEVFDSMSVCFAIEKSAAIGKPVTVNYL